SRFATVDLPTPVGPYNSRWVAPAGSSIAWVTTRSTSSRRGCLTLTALKVSSRARASGVIRAISDTPHTGGSSPDRGRHWPPRCRGHGPSRAAAPRGAGRRAPPGGCVLRDPAGVGEESVLRRRPSLKTGPGADHSG